MVAKQAMGTSNALLLGSGCGLTSFLLTRTFEKVNLRSNNHSINQHPFAGIMFVCLFVRSFVRSPQIVGVDYSGRFIDAVLAMQSGEEVVFGGS